MAASAAAAVLGLTLSSCAVNELGPGSGDSVGIIVGGGASSQQAAQEAWVVGFQTAHTGATVEYDPAGSGAGRDMFVAGGSAFAGSDRAFTVEELAESDFVGCAPGSSVIELPAYISPIALVFNLDGIDELRLDPSTIAGIFSSEITRWNDDAIAEQNPGIDLPDQAITAIHRSDDSGITENFTAYLAEAAPDAWKHTSSGIWPLSGGEAAQGTSGVVNSVSRGHGTIGYIDASRAGELGVVSVKAGDDYVPYSAEAAAAIVDASPAAEGRAEGDLAIELDRSGTAPGAYPIVLVSYLIGCSNYSDEKTAGLVREYFAYVVSPEGQQEAATHAGSSPISAELSERAAAAVALIS
ncbi:phosphate ABC transporter substrate-binding protein (PhoT family) [Homoserinimonas aerilata]|uniref:Phosphate-binding protein n=1 Tax=Homoserinimonas aerilata TaxID=1162970 RepID=A0A542YGB0_9MICO|nr:phosphate ABC transporter substrate-binding protein PstS [Homoserinimonas aerilata]TQL47024.1 phosphate ABC transporter substrate-binding protein (PhoT family) [Homoserinimonas aerilata]